MFSEGNNAFVLALVLSTRVELAMGNKREKKNRDFGFFDRKECILTFSQHILSKSSQNLCSETHLLVSSCLSKT